MVVGIMNQFMGCNRNSIRVSSLCTSKYSTHIFTFFSIQPATTTSRKISVPLSISSIGRIHAAFSLFFTSTIKSKSTNLNNSDHSEAFEQPMGKSSSWMKPTSAHLSNFNQSKVFEPSMGESSSWMKPTSAHLRAFGEKKTFELCIKKSTILGKTQLIPAPSSLQELTPKEREFEKWVQKLQRGFKPEDVADVLQQQRDLNLALDIFRWASQQRRYQHNHLTYRIMIQKLAFAKRFDTMEILIEEVMAGACTGSESLFNTMIYVYLQARRLGKAINVYKHMKKTSDCKPALKTYNVLMSALVNRGTNSYISHMYMEPIRSLFRQMIDADVAPDIFTLNLMIKGYSKSLHMNDALRVFHQMDLYGCSPNAHTFNYLIRGLTVQGRTINAMKIYRDMIDRGFAPSNMVYNSLINSLSIGGELQEASKVLLEMIDKGGVPDFITYKTLMDGLCKEGKVQEADKLLHEIRNKDYALDGFSYRKLLNNLQLRNATMDSHERKLLKD